MLRAIFFIGCEIVILLIEEKMPLDSYYLARIQGLLPADGRKLRSTDLFHCQRLVVIRLRKSGVSETPFPVRDDQLIHSAMQLHCHPIHGGSEVVFVIGVRDNQQRLPWRLG